MVPADLFAAFAVDLDSQDIADGYAATLDLAGMYVEVAIGSLAVVYANRSCVGSHVSGVADLTAAGGVERRFSEHDLDILAFRRLIQELAVFDNADDLGIGGQCPIAQEGNLLDSEGTVEIVGTSIG